jgi:site-specific recombinase XerD
MESFGFGPGTPFPVEDGAHTHRRARRTAPLRAHALLSTARGAGLNKIPFRDLRHSCASLLQDQCVDLIVVVELLDYALIAITADVCAHVRLDAIEHMSGALGNGPEP